MSVLIANYLQFEFDLITGVLLYDMDVTEIPRATVGLS